MRTDQVRNSGEICQTSDIDTPARLLHLLTLMSSRSTWRADELAERLEITERSVRRDVTRLRTLGYPIESVTGPYGGYSLAAGGQLPPLLLSDDEAVSMAVALHDVSQRSSSAIADGALSALTKLGQVMPAPLRERVGALTSVVLGLTSGDRFADNSADVETLMAVALSCARNERLRFDYKSGDGADSMRHTEPFRLVSVGHRWYLVAYDLDRTDWRTFRVDRISRPRATGARFQRDEVPDAAALVAEGLAVNAYEQRAVVRVNATLGRTLYEVPPTIGVCRVDPDDEQCTLVEIGGDVDWVARFLAGLELPYAVVEPAELVDELRRLGQRLVAANRRPRRPEPAEAPIKRPRRPRSTPSAGSS
ncbi:MAG: transcriptional regulator [Ilumatobacteraceae bacterium]|nr:transcriptional regulator [Ilumatobacteraceae bacterium]